MKRLSRLAGNGKRAGRLDRAIGLARESAAPSARLSGAARGRIVEAAMASQGSRTAPLPTLFAPARRLLIAGTLPVLLAAAFVGTLNR